jgi:hypothetical protein
MKEWMKNYADSGQKLIELRNKKSARWKASRFFIHGPTIFNYGKVFLRTVKLHDMFIDFYRPFVSVIWSPRPTLNGCVNWL